MAPQRALLTSVGIALGALLTIYVAGEAVFASFDAHETDPAFVETWSSVKDVACVALTVCVVAFDVASSFWFDDFATYRDPIAVVCDMWAFVRGETPHATVLREQDEIERLVADHLRTIAAAQPVDVIGQQVDDMPPLMDGWWDDVDDADDLVADQPALQAWPDEPRVNFRRRMIWERHDGEIVHVEPKSGTTVMTTIRDSMAEINRLCRENPELALFEAGVSCLLQISMSDGSIGATALALKDLIVKASILSGTTAEYATRLTSLIEGGHEFGEEIHDFTKGDLPQMTDDELRKAYKHLMRIDEMLARDDALSELQYDEELSEYCDVLEAIVVRLRKIYGLDLRNTPSSANIAAEWFSHPALREFVNPNDLVGTDTVVVSWWDEAVAGTNRAVKMHHIVTQNVIVLAIAGALGVDVLKDHAPRLHSLALAVMGPQRDLAKLLKNLMKLAQDTTVYLGYVLTGDVSYLSALEDSLTRAMIVQDRLEERFKECLGDGVALAADIDRHAMYVAQQHSAVRRAAQNQGEASPWGALFLRSLELSNAMRTRPSGQFKQEAFVLFAEGPVGTGKTVAIQRYCERIVSAVLDQSAPADGSFAETYIKTDPKFYDGMAPGCKTIGYDDTFGHTKSAAPGDGSIALFLKMCSRQVITAPMADVELKGRVRLSPAFVFVTENRIVDTVCKYTDCATAVLRRSNVWLRFKYVEGLVDGEDVDHETDVIVELCRYMVPRTNDFRVGPVEVLKTGTIHEIMEIVVEMAYQHGVEQRRQLTLQFGLGRCRTCGDPECKLTAVVPRKEHYRQKNARLLYAEGQRHVVEPVSGFTLVGVPLALLYFGKAFVRVTRAVDADTETDRPNGPFFGAVLAVPLLWMLGGLALTVLSPLMAATYIVWPSRFVRHWRAGRDWTIWIASCGDHFLKWVAPAVHADFTMYKAAIGCSLTVQQKLDAVRNSSKYAILVKIAVVLLCVATVYAANAALAPKVYVHKVVQPEESVAPQRLHVVPRGAGTPDAGKISRVLRRYTLVEGRLSPNAVVVPLGHNIALTVSHLVPRKGPLEVYQARVGRDIDLTKRPYQLSRDDVQLFAPDFAVLRDRHLVMYDADFVVGVPKFEDRDAVWVNFSVDGRVDVRDVRAHAKWDVYVCDRFLSDIEGAYVVYGISAVYGNCGSPLMYLDHVSGRWVIFAIVVSSTETYTIFAPVPRAVCDAVERLKASVPDGPCVQNLNVVCGRTNVEIRDVPLHPKSALQWADMTSFCVVGRTFPEVSASSKCPMVHTTFHDVAAHEFGGDPFVKPEWRPVLRPPYTYKRGMLTEHVEQVNASFDGLATVPGDVAIVMEHFKEVFADSPKSRVLTVREAILGVPGQIKSMNLQTSVGGLNRFGPKSQWTRVQPCVHYPNGRTFEDGFLQASESIYQGWLKGQSSPPTCRVSPKVNEVRTKPISRQINTVDAEWLLAARRLLEPIHRVMRNNARYWSMIGKSPIGSWWKKAHAHLMRGGNSDTPLSDGDFGHFDKCHGPTAREVVCEAYAYIAQVIGYSIDEVRAVRQCVMDGFNAFQCAFGEVWVALFGLISGVTATGDIQTFLCWFLLRVALVGVYGKMVLDQLSSIHGGDDVVFSLDTEVQYDAKRLTDRMAMLGYVFTSDTNKDEPPIMRSWKDVSFYKRKMLLVGSRLLAPLAIKSISKSLMWRDSTSKVTVREQERSILETAMNEAFLHGPEGYDALCAKIRRIAMSGGYDIKLEPWTDIAVKFDRDELRTWHYEPEIGLEGAVCTCYQVVPMSGITDLTGGPETKPDPQEIGIIDGNNEVVVAKPGRPVSLIAEVTDALRRPVLVSEVTWSAGLAASIYPIASLFSNAIYARNLTYFYLHRFMLKIKVSVTAPAMSCGAIVASIYSQNNVDLWQVASNYNANQIITHDCSGMIDIAVGNTLELSRRNTQKADAMVPYASDQYIGTHMLRFAIAELAPFSTAMTTASVPTIYIWAWLEDATQAGPTPVQALSGQTDLGEFAPRFTRAVARFYQSTGVGTVLRAGKAVAEALIDAGFSFVAQLPLITYVFQRRQPMFATAEGADATVRLDYIPTSLSRSNHQYVSGESTDLMSFRSILNRPSLWGVVSWTQASTAHTLLASIPVTPFLNAINGTPMGWLASMFVYWTGSIKVNFYISCPSMARGALVFCYVPNVNQSGTGWSALTQQNPTVVDVAGSTSFEMDIGWHAPVAAIGASSGATYPTIAAPLSGNWVPNGWIYIYVQQQLLTAGATAMTIPIVVTARPGDDFALFDPWTNVIRNFEVVSGKTPLFQADARHYSVRFEGIRREPDDVAHMSGGSIVSSLRTLLKRKAANMFQYFTSTPSSTYVPATSYQFPTFLSGVGTSGTTSDDNYLVSHFSWSAIPFAMWSGSLRHTIMGPVPVNGGAALPAVTFGYVSASRLSYGSGATTTPLVFSSTVWKEDYNTLDQLNNGADVELCGNGATFCVSVECPFYAPFHALPVATPASLGDDFPQVLVVLHNVVTPSPNYGLIDFLSAGDDFEFIEWVGVPKLTYNASGYGHWSAIA